jgi:rhodanese-related sulfurtransferase/DUF4097 and DUF4098 domain-containing protein YvlB
MSTTAISSTKFAELCKEGRKVDLIDVRTPAEYEELHVEFARNFPLDQLDPALVMRSRADHEGGPLYVICRSGSRSDLARAKFEQAGFTNVLTVEGGTLACVEAGLPVVRRKKANAWKRPVFIAAAIVLLGALLGWLVRSGVQGASGRSGYSVSRSDGVTTITVDGQTIVLKETEKEPVGKTFRTGPAPNVVVEVFNGNITVDAAAEGAVEVEVTKTALGETREDAQANLELIAVQMQQEGDTIRIAAKGVDDGKEGDPQSIEYAKRQVSARSADVVVKVPASAALELRTSFGEVKVVGIAGDVDAKSDSGSVAASGGKGALRLASDFGDVTVDGQNTAVTVTTKSGSVKVTGAKGPLDISSHFGTVDINGAAEKVVAHSMSGDVTVKDAAGSVQATSGFGAVTVEGAGSVQAETKSGDVIVKRATKPVRATSGFGKLTIEEALAGATVEAKSGDIRVKGARGAVSLTTGFGQIDAEVVEATVNASSKSGDVIVRGTLTTGEHSLHSDFGAITLVLPADSQFKLDAETKFGTVDTAFAVKPVHQNTDKRVQGNVGDQPRVTLKLTTSSGDIRVRRP